MKTQPSTSLQAADITANPGEGGDEARELLLPQPVVQALHHG